MGQPVARVGPSQAVTVLSRERALQLARISSTRRRTPHSVLLHGVGVAMAEIQCGHGTKAVVSLLVVITPTSALVTPVCRIVCRPVLMVSQIQLIQHVLMASIPPRNAIAVA